MSIRNIQSAILSELRAKDTVVPEDCMNCPNLVVENIGALGISVSTCQLEQAVNDRGSSPDPSRRRRHSALWITEALFKPSVDKRVTIPVEQLNFRGKAHRANEGCPVVAELVRTIGELMPEQPLAEIEVIPPTPLVPHEVFSVLKSLQAKP